LDASKISNREVDIQAEPKLFVERFGAIDVAYWDDYHF
jgi:hypothetical protein